MNQNGVLTIFVGQAGVQIGNCFWELLCSEHSIDKNGTITDTQVQSENIFSFYQDLKDGRCVPRCLLIDLEPTVVDEVRSGSFRNLFKEDSIINGFEDSGGNFARGFYTVGRLLLPKICDQLRKYLEFDSYINGVIIFRSLGGGTGAGLTSAIFDALVDCRKVTRLEVPIYPSNIISSSTVEPYNALLSEHFCMEEIELGMLFDNEAMFDICDRELSIDSPTFNNINQLVSQTMSCITSSLRFSSILNCDLNVLQTNLVPYPRIHFPISSYTPVVSLERLHHHNYNVYELTYMAFDDSTQLLKVNVLDCKYMSCTLFYRGDVSPNEVYDALRKMKNEKFIRFVDWCPTGFKVSISNPTYVDIPNSKMARTKISVASLTNSSMVARAWNSLNSKFQILYQKKAFMHWYIGEGLEETEFDEAQLNIGSLVRDYLEASAENVSIDVSKSHDSHDTKIKDNDNNVYNIQNSNHKTHYKESENYHFPIISSTHSTGNMGKIKPINPTTQLEYHGGFNANKHVMCRKDMILGSTNNLSTKHAPQILYRTDSSISLTYNSRPNSIENVSLHSSQDYQDIVRCHLANDGNMNNYKGIHFETKLNKKSHSIPLVVTGRSDSSYGSETEDFPIHMVTSQSSFKHSRNYTQVPCSDVNLRCSISKSLISMDNDVLSEQMVNDRFRSSCKIFINDGKFLL